MQKSKHIGIKFAINAVIAINLDNIIQNNFEKNINNWSGMHMEQKK